MSYSTENDQSPAFRMGKVNGLITGTFLRAADFAHRAKSRLSSRSVIEKLSSDRGDVPGWVLVVLMTTGLVTAIWTIAAPRLSSILRNSLDAMNAVR